MTQTIAIIDYGSGNLRSVARAFERAAREADITADIRVTDDAQVIAEADRIALPGVGAFGACMNGLKARDGVIAALEHAVLVRGQPFIGVCVGMQLLATRGLEFGEYTGLGWVGGTVQKMNVEALKAKGLSVPHMGWSEVISPARREIPKLVNGGSYYFAHSYHFDVENEAHIYGVTTHGDEIVAAVGRDNIVGVQFHPEKSQSAGIKLIAGFMKWTP